VGMSSRREFVAMLLGAPIAAALGCGGRGARIPPGVLVDTGMARGHALIRDLPAGAHAVTAWLPPRGGQPARVGHGSATVAAGDLEELTVRLTK